VKLYLYVHTYINIWIDYINLLTKVKKIYTVKRISRCKYTMYKKIYKVKVKSVYQCEKKNTLIINHYMKIQVCTSRI